MTRVALTIDTEHPDHPAGPGNPEAVLDALAAAGAPATFFVQGRWARAHPQLARRIADDRHRIGNHSCSHAPMDMLTDDGIASSLREAADMIEAASGADPRPLFRCPYGDGADDSRVLAAIERAGYRHVGWDVDTEDWKPGRAPEEIVSTVCDGVEGHGDGAIVLMHVWPDPTPAALPELIDRLRRDGAELVRVDDLG
jgi:peptidoglycan/xylan/chitin deacetylase (PgdA/CDA1 family)